MVAQRWTNVYPPGADDDTRREMNQFDESVFAKELSTHSLKVQLQHQRAPARPDGEEEEVKSWTERGGLKEKFFSYFLTLGPLTGSFLTPCSWMLLM